MGREEQIVSERLKKLEELRKTGWNYPSKFEKNFFSNEVLREFSYLKEEEFSKKEIKLAGRIMVVRDFGKILFFNLKDGEGEIQVTLQKEFTPKNVFEFFKKFVDSGDIIGVEGMAFKTKKGIISVMAKKIEILSKAIYPLPSKWHGLKDEEEKFRKRYLDILMSNELKELFIKKSEFWDTTRSFLKERGFLEVETPVLETSAGGASATPFKTHHNSLDIDVYLRISMGELWQKELLIAGYEKTFEIGRQFRNEGMDSEHLQDYTQMEFYWAYASFEDGMKLVEELYKKLAKKVLGRLKFKTRGYEVDLNKKWKKYDFEKVIKEFTGVEIYKDDEKKIISVLEKLKVDYDKGAGKWRLVDALWKYARKKITGPGFLVGQPVELSPLAKRLKKDNRKVEQFQVLIAGTELGNGYSELNDPFDQEERFKEQQKLKDLGDKDAQTHDENFVEALKYGMPPACGFGFSERFFAYLVDKPLRECVIFPLMKPLSKNKKEVRK